MKQYQRKIEEYKSLIQKEYIRETAVHTVKERCSDILNRQDNRRVRLQVRARLVLAVQEHVIIVAIKLVLMLVARIVNLHV